MAMSRLPCLALNAQLYVKVSPRLLGFPYDHHVFQYLVVSIAELYSMISLSVDIFFMLYSGWALPIRPFYIWVWAHVLLYGPVSLGDTSSNLHSPLQYIPKKWI